MQTVHRILISFLTILVSALAAVAQDGYAGMLNSASGHGVCAMIPARYSDEMNTVIVKADTYGLLSGRTSDIGVTVSYTRDYLLRKIDNGDTSINIYFGAGAMAGYVHDWESGFFSKTERQLNKPMGMVAAIACTLGATLDFERRISLVFRLNAYPGIHIRSDETNMALHVSMYKNGIAQMVIPAVCIMYRF